MARRRGGTSRDYPRTARVNELLREIIGDTLERLDDPRLEWVSITGVVTNPELTGASVYYSSLSGPEGDAAVLEALGEQRYRLQAAIGRQARLRRTPELQFAPDSGVRSGQRLEQVLRELDDGREIDPSAEQPTGDQAAAEQAAGEQAAGEHGA